MGWKRSSKLSLRNKVLTKDFVITQEFVILAGRHGFAIASMANGHNEGL